MVQDISSMIFILWKKDSSTLNHLLTENHSDRVTPETQNRTNLVVTGNSFIIIKHLGPNSSLINQSEINGIALEYLTFYFRWPISVKRKNLNSMRLRECTHSSYSNLCNLHPLEQQFKLFVWLNSLINNVYTHLHSFLTSQVFNQ